MNVIRSIFFYLAIFIVVIIGCVIVMDPKFNYTITQAQVQTALDQKLPFTAPARGMLLFTAENGTVVHFQPDGRIAVNGNFSAKPTFTQSSHYEGQLVASGNLVYEDGAFYIRGLKLDDIGGHAVLSDRAKILGTIAGNLRNKLADTLDISSEDLNTVLGVNNMKEHATNYLAEKLAHIPVYKLDKKWWSPLARHSLENITVADQTITVTLGIGHLLLYIVGAICVAALIIGFIAATIMLEIPFWEIFLILSLFG